MRCVVMYGTAICVRWENEIIIAYICFQVLKKIAPFKPRNCNNGSTCKVMISTLFAVIRYLFDLQLFAHLFIPTVYKNGFRLVEREESYKR